MPSFVTSGQRVEVDGIRQRSNFTANNFSTVVIYRIIAADKTSKEYRVSISITNDSITSFSFENPKATGVIYGNNIILTVPYGTNLSSLTPTIEHTGIGMNPASGTPRNFSSPVLYTVVAQDGTAKFKS